MGGSNARLQYVIPPGMAGHATCTTWFLGQGAAHQVCPCICLGVACLLACEAVRYGPARAWSGLVHCRLEFCVHLPGYFHRAMTRPTVWLHGRVQRQTVGCDPAWTGLLQWLDMQAVLG